MINCYYCNNPETSKEHVPPKLLFRDFKVDSITVPSCDKHNNSKSGDDQVFVSAMLLTLKNTLPTYNWEPEVVRAINEAEDLYPRTKNRITQSPILGEEFAGLNLPLAHTDKPMLGWIRHITAGLVYNATRFYDSSVDWDSVNIFDFSLLPDFDLIQPPESPDNFSVILDWCLSNRAKLEAIEEVEWLPGWSSGPRNYPQAIYNFKVRIASSTVFFLHTFYGQLIWLVAFNPCEETIQKLKDKLVVEDKTNKHD